MKKKMLIKQSPFSNTYGGLSIVLGEDEHMYLEMEGCSYPDYFGPLTDEQVAAFHVLCDVDDVARTYATGRIDRL